MKRNVRAFIFFSSWFAASCFAIAGTIPADTPLIAHTIEVRVQTTGAYRLPPLFSTKRGVSFSGRETNYLHQTRMPSGWPSP